MKKITSIILFVVFSFPLIASAQEVNQNSILIASLTQEVHLLEARIQEIESYETQLTSIRETVSMDTANANAICDGTALNPVESCATAIKGVQTEIGLYTLLSAAIEESIAQLENE